MHCLHASTDNHDGKNDHWPGHDDDDDETTVLGHTRYCAYYVVDLDLLLVLHNSTH